MADINSQAKDLTESLKKGTGAARGLAAELAGVHAARLARGVTAELLAALRSGHASADKPSTE